MKMEAVKLAVLLFCSILFFQVRYGNAACNDYNTYCRFWARNGECERNPRYMKIHCRKSCNVCVAKQQASAGIPKRCDPRTGLNCPCHDRNWNCKSWAARGECQRNQRYMKVNCRKSCHLCRAPDKKIVCNFVTCSWGQWSSWSATCGNAMRQRKVIARRKTAKRVSCKGLRRKCPKQNPQSERRTTKCPCNFVVCLVGEWSSWSTACGVGHRTRYVDTSLKSVMRTSCNGLRQSCHYVKMETRTKNCTCNYVDCVYSEWSGWSKSCGTRERKRMMLSQPRHVSLLNCDGLIQHCPGTKEVETETKQCNESDKCYVDGKEYKIGELYIDNNCTSMCICNGKSSPSCSSLCTQATVVCGPGEYKVLEMEHVINSNCSCPVSKCLETDSSINSNGCGYSSTTSSQSLFIIGGKNAILGEWPWMAAVVKVGYPKQIYCGATLLNTQWALSAAHCFSKPYRNDPQNYIIRIGEYSLDKKENEVERRIRKIVLHSDYATGNFNNDIALLHLEQPVEYNKFVKPICINDGAISYPTGTKCMVTGWGRTQNEIGPYSSILQQLEVPMISHQTCVSAFEKFLTAITQNMVCAGYVEGGKDSCSGDSGGPLMCRISQGSPWQQVGVVSFGKGCARAGVYGVYTKVNNYFTWIKDQISNPR